MSGTTVLALGRNRPRRPVPYATSSATWSGDGAGNVVGLLSFRSAHAWERGEGRGPGPRLRRVRRNTNPSTEAPLRPSQGLRRGGVEPVAQARAARPAAIWVATPTGSRTRPRSRRASTTMDTDSGVSASTGRRASNRGPDEQRPARDVHRRQRPPRAVGRTARPSSRRRRAGSGSPRVLAGPRGARPCWTGRSAPPSPPRAGARPGPPPRSAGSNRSDPRGHIRSGPRGPRSGRRGCGSPGTHRPFPGSPRSSDERAQLKGVACGPRRCGAPPRQRRGRRSGPATDKSHRSDGMQSESTNAASTAVHRGQSGVARARPGRRWRPARRSARRGAPRSPWWRPRRPTRRRPRCRPSPRSAPSSRSSCAGRSRTGTTTVTSSSPKLSAAFA